jgi:MFS family permease
MLTSLIISLFSVSTVMFNVLTLISGFAFGGIEIITFVLLSEFIDSNYRNYFIGALNSASGVAMLFSSVNAWVLYEWKAITLTNIVVIALAMIPTYKLHESPRYLASVKGKYRQSKVILREIALYNKMRRFEGLLEGEKVIGYHEGT